MAYSFAAYRNKKVLLIDNDKQGNISKFMRRQDYAKKSLSDILSETANIHEVIRDTNANSSIVTGIITSSPAASALMTDILISGALSMMQ